MSDAEFVLDSSVVLASLFKEFGAEALDPILPRSLISSVNLCEVVTELQERGLTEEDIDDTLDGLNLAIAPFDDGHAIGAGKLRAATRHLGLSLGDRACLALAMAEGAIAVTMDRNWAALDLPVEIRVARG